MKSMFYVSICLLLAMAMLLGGCGSPAVSEITAKNPAKIAADPAALTEEPVTVAGAVAHYLRTDCFHAVNRLDRGTTGVMAAAVKAVETVDACMGRIVAEVAKHDDVVLVVTADHGNADNALNPDGTPNTAHSLNPVPIVVVSDRVKSVHDGILADVAPTVLKLMGLEQPAEMTGKALVELK